MAGLWTSRQINRQVAFMLLAFGSGVLLGRVMPPVLWSLAVLALGVYLLMGWRRGAGFALLFLFGALIAAPTHLFGAPVQRGEQTRVYKSTSADVRGWADVKTLVVRNSAGTIDVTGGTGPSLEATYVYGKRVRIPSSLLTSYSAGKLDFTGVEPSLPLEQRRGVRARLHASVPRGVALEVHGRMGDVSAERLGAVRIDTNIGDIRVREVTGAVVASSDVGDVAISEVEGGIEVHTQVGHILIDLTSKPASAPVLAQTDIGDITLVVSPDVDAHIIASSVTQALPAEMTRRKPTEGVLTLGRGTRPVVLKTRIGAVRVLRQ